MISKRSQIEVLIFGCSALKSLFPVYQTNILYSLKRNFKQKPNSAKFQNGKSCRERDRDLHFPEFRRGHMAIRRVRYE